MIGLRFIVVLCSLLYAPALAGQSAFGLSAGISQHRYYLPGQQDVPGLEIDNRNKTGFQAGLHYDLFAGRSFFTNLQAQWRYYRSEITALSSGALGGSSTTGDLTFNNVELSVVPAVLFGNAVYLWLGAGAYGQFNLQDPTVEVTERSWLLQPQSMTEEQRNIRQSELFNRSQAGLLGVVGLRLHFIGKTQLLIRFTYRHGLTETGTRALHQYAVKQNSMGLDLGLNFYRFREITHRPHF